MGTKLYWGDAYFQKTRQVLHPQPPDQIVLNSDTLSTRVNEALKVNILFMIFMILNIIQLM